MRGGRGDAAEDGGATGGLAGGGAHGRIARVALEGALADTFTRCCTRAADWAATLPAAAREGGGHGDGQTSHVGRRATRSRRGRRRVEDYDRMRGLSWNDVRSGPRAIERPRDPLVLPPRPRYNAERRTRPLSLSCRVPCDGSSRWRRSGLRPGAFHYKAPAHVIPLALARATSVEKTCTPGSGRTDPRFHESRGTKFEGSRTVKTPGCASAFQSAECRAATCHLLPYRARTRTHRDRNSRSRRARYASGPSLGSSPKTETARRARQTPARVRGHARSWRCRIDFN